MIKDKSLTPHTLLIIRESATEKPHTGSYTHFYKEGSYLCKGCGIALFRAHSKFNASCGWPSFDESITQNVTEKKDKDGLRTEIVCTQCNAHLGHVFYGEQLTSKNKRFCVNSQSLDFISNTNVIKTEEAILAGGCFWGVDFLLGKLPGVLFTEVGYTGGDYASPTYNDVCTGNTGHFEAVRVIYSPSQIDYERLLKYFFEIHDPSQLHGQGPDIGSQYQSAVFYYDDNQRKTAEKLILELEKSITIATKLLPVQTFWPAEELHQDYYLKTKHQPYCHFYTPRFKNT
ncbi:MAG: bifunctional methionine sulfoxide reductase B/A protein [Legionella sp.]|nr:bifunctional methionine sulfoxide reductase B/A protein [Legionella sp.]